ncbi:hypothetical protein ACWCQZ_41035 [Streptomyces sp. NPDC002285]
MTSEERRAILRDAVIEEINQRVDAAPDPTPELVEDLRRIWTSGRTARPVTVPADSAADAA